MRARWRWALLGFLCVIWTRVAVAETAPLVPRAVLFGNPERSNPEVSPDGKYLTYLAPDKKNVLQLWMRTIGKDDDRPLTADKRRGIHSYFWTFAGQVVYLEDNNGDENFHLISVDIATNIIRDLTPFQGVRAQGLDLDPSFPRQALVGLNLKNKSRFDIYRINLETGAVVLDTPNPGNFVAWTPDEEFQVRAATAASPQGGFDLLYRATTKSPWEKLRHWSPEEEGAPIIFSRGGKTLYLMGNHDANTTRLLALDLATRKETVVAEDPNFDVANWMAHPLRRTIQSVSFNKDKLVRKVLDHGVAEDFECLDKRLGGNCRMVSRDLADKLWVIGCTSDDRPTRYYLYDRNTKQETFLFSSQPKLEKVKLSSMKPISYRARDGLTIHGYLTLPVGTPARDLPAILLVHGGPWARDSWGFSPMTQWLANRGYAVLQVNYRGSAGYGKKFLNAGNREWGRKMHFDLIDGVNWLVKQGIADPKKIAIMGGSYGGYATLAGLAFTPDVFAAGVDIVGPSNLITLLNTIPAYWAPVRALFDKRVGNALKDQDFLKARSPLFAVDRMKAPLLIGQGANDPRVKQAESDQIVAALRQAGKDVQYIIYTDEGHGFIRPENRLHFFAHAEAFLARHLGGRAEPANDIKGHSGIIK
jgi:dipeptidyl aminopeptidase/acylaminoacyl peptidase